MTHAASQPRLRLVGSGDAAGAERWARERSARQRIAQENIAAAGNRALDPTDPRWVLAARAYAQLQGSMLTPERRGRLMRTAKLLGVRQFDANVIIAVVQDSARRGEALGQTASTIAMIPKPRRSTRRAVIALRWVLALLAAAAANVLLIRWLIG